MYCIQQQTQQQQRHDASRLTVLPNLAVLLPKLNSKQSANIYIF